MTFPASHWFQAFKPRSRRHSSPTMGSEEIPSGLFPIPSSRRKTSASAPPGYGRKVTLAPPIRSSGRIMGFRMTRKWIIRTEPAPRVTLDVNKKQANLRSSIADPFSGISTIELQVRLHRLRPHLNSKKKRWAQPSRPAAWNTPRVRAQTDRPFTWVPSAASSLSRICPILGVGMLFCSRRVRCKAPYSFSRRCNSALLTLQVGGRIEHDHGGILIPSDPDLTSLTSPNQKNQDFTPLSVAARRHLSFRQAIGN